MNPKTGRSWLLTSRYEDRSIPEAMLDWDSKSAAKLNYVYTIERVDD